MERPDVYIITVCLNSEKTIERCLESACRQDYPNKRLVVIDGQSTDGTLGVIERYKDKLHYFTSGRDGGIYQAMNKGVQSIADKGAYVYFLNSDDSFFGDFAISRALSQANNEDFIYGNIILKDEEFSVVSGREITLKDLEFKTTCHHQAIFAKRFVFDRVGFFDASFRIAADYDWVVRVFLDDGISKKYVRSQVATMEMLGVSHRNVLKSGTEKLRVVRRHFSPIKTLRSQLYFFALELPRRFISVLLRKFGLLKSWRAFKMQVHRRARN